MPALNSELVDWLQVRVDHLPPSLREAALRERLTPLLLASDYAHEQLRRDPSLLDSLDAPPARLELSATEEAQWPALLRRFRHQHSLAMIAADVAGCALESTLAHSSWLAEHCLQQAHNALFNQLIGRHGMPRGRSGAEQSLVVMALGKLGGAELNFSSDIDLVYAFAEGGSSDGDRALDNDSFFQRLGQKLIQLLGDVTGDGFGFRVDMRLRPFGNAGRLALSFNAMEQYYQRDGRDWERYAWIKARPVAGDIDAGNDLLDLLRPFVYRRFLDYTAFDGLREMKALIEAEVQRRDLADHLKLGPGGIREIEFIVQLQQLIRGGREPALRRTGLLAALSELELRGFIDGDSADQLRSAYRFLRRLENRVQMVRDEQIHTLPEDPLLQARLAYGMGFSDWDSMFQTLQVHRDRVRDEFTRVFEARERRPQAVQTKPLREYWRQIERGASAEQLAACGIDQAESLHRALLSLASSVGTHLSSAQARQRLDRLMPDLLAAAATQADVGTTVARLIALLQAVIRRPSYLALLDEQPAALQRLVEVMAGSGLLAERIIAHPILLDDLLDSRAESAPPDRDWLWQSIEDVLARHPDDVEQALHELNEIRQSMGFRIGLASLVRQQPAAEIAEQLATLAECLVDAIVLLAVSDLRAAHGVLQGHEDDAGLGLIGYGSLGGWELGFGSDLDLVFLFDGDDMPAQSDGPRPLETGRYQLRVVQKIIALLSTLTPAGRLYEVDLRLRPDGAKGLLLVSLQSFTEYQRDRAWTWEHQALLRARPVAGARRICERFSAIRREVLQRPRQREAVLADVARMRQRMRTELDRGRPPQVDLKQGAGGLVDLEFLLQAEVLCAAADHPVLIEDTRTPVLIQQLSRCLPARSEQFAALGPAHELLLRRSLDCTLDGRPRLAVPDADLDAALKAISTAWQEAGLAGS